MNKRQSESGSALVYILIAIALLALLTVTFMEPSSQQTQSQNTFKMVSEVESQIDFIRSAVQECIILHAGGDITIDNTSGGSDPGANRRYPINPDSTHFAAATIGRAGNRQVKNIRCSGNPGDDDDHELMFGGSTGKFMPPAPSLFDEWQWYNGSDGIFFWIETDKTDAYISSALSKAEDEFAECEADVIDATGGAEDLDEDSTVSCSAGAICFRVWMVADTVRGGAAVETGRGDNQAAHYPTEVACDTP